MNNAERLLLGLCDEQAKDDSDMSRLTPDMFQLEMTSFAQTVLSLQDAGYITGAFIAQPTPDGEGVWFSNLRNVWVTENGVQKARQLLQGLSRSN